MDSCVDEVLAVGGIIALIILIISGAIVIDHRQFIQAGYTQEALPGIGESTWVKK